MLRRGKEVTVDDENYLSLELTLNRMKSTKPPGPSEEARAYAIVITDLEKSLAYFKMFVIDKKPKPTANPDEIYQA